VAADVTLSYLPLTWFWRDIGDALARLSKNGRPEADVLLSTRKYTPSPALSSPSVPAHWARRHRAWLDVTTTGFNFRAAHPGRTSHTHCFRATSAQNSTAGVDAPPLPGRTTLYRQRSPAGMACCASFNSGRVAGMKKNHGQVASVTKQPHGMMTVEKLTHSTKTHDLSYWLPFTTRSPSTARRLQRGRAHARACILRARTLALPPFGNRARAAAAWTRPRYRARTGHARAGAHAMPHYLRRAPRLPHERNAAIRAARCAAAQHGLRTRPLAHCPCGIVGYRVQRRLYYPCLLCHSPHAGAV